MNTPEAGHCTTETYERGKRFMVTPDRLCIEGLYTFAFKAGSRENWQACRLPVQVTDVEPPKDNADDYLVTIQFDEPFVDVLTYPISADGGGIINWPQGSYAEEAYMKHCFDETDSELNTITTNSGSHLNANPTPPLVPAGY